MSFPTMAFAPSQGFDPAESHPENNEFRIVWPDTEVCRTDLVNWLRLFVEDGQSVEIRYPKAKAERSFSRFNADLAKAVEEALLWSGKVPGVYFTLNPIRPALAPEKAATDKDILRRRWLLIDCDPTRPGDTSSTDAEKADALTLAPGQFTVSRCPVWRRVHRPAMRFGEVPPRCWLRPWSAASRSSHFGRQPSLQDRNACGSGSRPRPL